jgi:hypothetical protein
VTCDFGLWRGEARRGEGTSLPRRRCSDFSGGSAPRPWHSAGGGEERLWHGSGGEARRGVAWRGEARRGMAWRGEAWHGVARAHHSHGEGAAISPAVARRGHGTPRAEARSVSGMAAVARRGEGMVLRRRKRGATSSVWPHREPSSSASRSNVHITFSRRRLSSPDR